MNKNVIILIGAVVAVLAAGGITAAVVLNNNASTEAKTEITTVEATDVLATDTPTADTEPFVTEEPTGEPTETAETEAPTTDTEPVEATTATTTAKGLTPEEEAVLSSLAEVEEEIKMQIDGEPSETTAVTIPEEILALSTEPVETEPVEDDGFAPVNYIGYCNATPVNIRKEPSLEAEKLGTASYGDEINVIGEKTIDSVVWAKINTDNGIAYMVAQYISKSMVTETAEAEPETVAEPSPSAIVPEVPEDAEGIKYIEELGGEAYYKYGELNGKEELWVWTWMGDHWEWIAHPALTPEEEAWWEKKKEQDLNGDGNYTLEEYYEWLETQPLEVQERVHAWGDIELHFN